MALDDLMAALNAGSKNAKERNGYFTARDALSGFQFQPSRKERETGKTDWKKQLMGMMGVGLLGGVLDGLGQRKNMQDEQSKAMRLNMALSSANPSAMLAADPEFAHLGPVVALEDYKQRQAKAALADELTMRANADLRKQGILVDGDNVTVNPQILDARRRIALAEKGVQEAPEYGAPLPTQPIVDDLPGLNPGVPPINELVNRRYMDLLRLDPNMSRAKALDEAKASVAGERKASERSYQIAEEAYKNADTLKNLAGQAEAAVQGAGYTGPWNTILSPLSNLTAGIFDSSRQNSQAEGNLDSMGAQFMGMNRVKGTGAVSDYESKMYVKAGPSKYNTPEVNQAIIGKMKELANLESEYADFVETFRNKYGTTNGANQAWQQYKEANPLFVPGASGDLELNQSRPSWRDYFSRAQQQQQAPQIQAPTYQMTDTPRPQGRRLRVYDSELGREVLMTEEEARAAGAL